MVPGYPRLSMRYTRLNLQKAGHQAVSPPSGLRRDRRDHQRGRARLLWSSSRRSSRSSITGMMMRTTRQLEKVIAGIKANPGLVHLHHGGQGAARALQEPLSRAVRCPVSPCSIRSSTRWRTICGPRRGACQAASMRSTLNISPAWTRWTSRMDHDDGQQAATWTRPTSSWLGSRAPRRRRPASISANRGIKAANVPLRPRLPLPKRAGQTRRPAGRRPDQRPRPARPDPPQPSAAAERDRRDRTTSTSKR